MKKVGQDGITEVYLEMTDASRTRRRGINSVEIGVRILESVMALKHPATLKAIANHAGMDASQTHRYLSSLVNTGILQQRSRAGLYDLGPKALQVGLSALSRLDPIRVISAAMDEFANEHGYTCLMAIWGSTGPIIIRWCHGSPPVYTMLSIGSVLPVTSSATGQVFMTFLAESLIAPFLLAEGWKVPLSVNRRLRQIQTGVRTSRLAHVDNTVIPGLRAYAAPIFGIRDSLLATVTIVASDSIPRDRDGAMRQHLTALCNHLSGEFGGDRK